MKAQKKSIQGSIEEKKELLEQSNLKGKGLQNGLKIVCLEDQEGQIHFLPFPEPRTDNDFRILLHNLKKNCDLRSQELADMLAVPKRTLDNWLIGRNFPPSWVVSLLMPKIREITDFQSARIK